MVSYEKSLPGHTDAVRLQDKEPFQMERPAGASPAESKRWNGKTVQRRWGWKEVVEMEDGGGCAAEESNGGGGGEMHEP